MKKINIKIWALLTFSTSSSVPSEGYFTELLQRGVLCFWKPKPKKWNYHGISVGWQWIDPCWPVHLESNSFKRNWEFYNTDIKNLETIPENYSILVFQRKAKFRKSFSKFMLLAIFECFGVVIFYFRRCVLHMLFLRKNLRIFL